MGNSYLPRHLIIGPSGYVAEVTSDNALKVDATSAQAASTVGDNRLTVTTAGTRVQFPSVTCKYVIVQGLEANAGIVVVGGSTVVAASGTRRGIQLAPLQSERFDVSNLNLLYLDSANDGDGVGYVYFS